MKNKKVIVVNGLGHGGTNIVWNLIASHPDVCLPRWETGEILRATRFLWRLQRGDRPLHPLLAFIGWRLADRRFFRLKMESLHDLDHNQRMDGEPYSRERLAATALCLKSVNEDIELSDDLRRLYDDIFFVGVVRNGYAWCEGMMRRNRTPGNAGQFYRRFVGRMIRDAQIDERFTIVRFEDVLKDPFGTAATLFAFLGLEPVDIPKLRLKAKPTLRADGSRTVRFGADKAHYWFDRSEIKDALDPNIDAVQAGKLSEEDRLAFEAGARAELEHFGYR